MDFIQSPSPASPLDILPARRITSLAQEGAMKISKSTTILVNVVLVLLIAILVKSLIAAPRSAVAGINKEFMIYRGDMQATANAEILKKSVDEGWRFVFAYTQNDVPCFIFEK
jgi:hypothetical protein